MEPIIKISKLQFAYNKGKNNEYQALTNINIEIFPEEFIIIFGPSGCGKSTLLNIIAGLENPESGDVIIDNKNITQISKEELIYYHRKEIGMIYQSYNLIHTLSVIDNITLPQMFLNNRKKEREQKGLELLKRFNVLEQGKKLPSELSGGQQQRVGIARAIINDPKIILADEPIGNLDSVSAKNVLNILEELNKKEKKTVILVTHSPEYLDYCDRIFHMKDGIIIQETVNREKHVKKYTVTGASKPPMTEINDLMRAYRGLAPEQINILIMPYKAKVFANHFITTLNMEELKIFEDLIQRRLLGTISQDEFLDVLDRPTSKGGIGFDRRTAEKIMRRVNRAIRIAYYVYQKGRQRKDTAGYHEKISDDDKSQKLTDYLLKTCYKEHQRELNILHILRLKQAVKDHINGKIAKQEFYAYLDRPFKMGGVGLNSRTAKLITEEMELILILGYGIVQRKKPIFNISNNQSNDQAKEIAKEEEVKEDNKLI